MKGYGLGKNSPVKITTGKDNYEGLISRHGQLVRWRQALKCPCVGANGRPDLKCSVCGGEGWRYQFQKDIEETIPVAAVDNDMLELPETRKDAEILGICNYAGVVYPPASRYGRYIRTMPGFIHRGDRADVVINRTLLRTLGSCPLTYVGNGRFEADIGSGDIIAARNFSLSGKSVLAVRRNGVLTDVADQPEGIVAYADLEVLDPPTFVIVNQQAKEPDARFVAGVGGSASMSFPGAFKIGQGDVVTALSARQVGKALLTHQGGFDTIPEFYVAAIDHIETTSKTFVRGTDYDLWGDNLIRWVPGKDAPKVGEAIVVLYQASPTYRVLQEFPASRSSENLDLPRRVALALLSTYSPRKGL